MADIEVDGRVIEQGSIVMTGLASANHDPAKWGDDADRIERREDRVLGGETEQQTQRRSARDSRR